MNEERLALAGVDYADGVKRFCGKAELYEKYLGRFPEDENYVGLVDALGANDYEAAFRYAHTLKGIAGNLSLATLYTKICPLVEALRGGQTSGLEALLAPVAKSHAEVLQALA